MKRRILLAISLWLIFTIHLSAQTFSIMTWNIQDLGRTKTDDEIEMMAEVMKNYDIIAVQEVVGADYAGAQKVALIADYLNRKGSRWDYKLSDRTDSPSPYIAERYAFFWKPSRVTLKNDPYLDKDLKEECDREPYIARFQPRGSNESFYVISFHARRFDNHPDEEIKHFVNYPQRLKTNQFFIVGDFNLDEKHEVWQPFYAKGFVSAIQDKPTTLKRKCDRKDDYFNYPIDNIYFHSERFENVESGRVDFVLDCKNLEIARGVSDHLPVYVKVKMISP